MIADIPSFLSLSKILTQVGENEIDTESLTLLKQFAKLSEQPGDTVALSKFMITNGTAVHIAVKKYQSMLNDKVQEIVSLREKKGLEEITRFFADSIKPGIGRDVLLTRMAIGENEQTKVLTKDQLTYYHENIDNGVLNEEINRSNKTLFMQLTRKVPSGTKILPALKATQDSLFKSLIAPYKGKVVYIDFWAPWCGPCMASMPDSKSLHAKLKGKKVVFLYLCVQCAAERWKNTIKSWQLPGKHYRLSNDENALLRNRFQIGGIPRYILVDKNGLVADTDADRPGNSNIKDEINRLLEK